jgi:hypothetical protein
MSNFANVRLVEDSFAFVPRGLADKPRAFKQGDALRGGRFVQKAVCALIAPRETVEGGRDLRDEYWLQNYDGKSPGRPTG